MDTTLTVEVYIILEMQSKNTRTVITRCITHETYLHYKLKYRKRNEIITSTAEGGYVFGSVCLSVCPSDYSQTCERILTKFFGGVGHGSRIK